MERLKNKYVIIGIIGALLIAGGLYWFVLADDSADTEPTANSEQSETNPDEEANSDDAESEEQNEEPSNENQELPEDPKPPVTNVLNEPVIYTGFGNTPERPLGLEQTTSTTCTTDANIECRLIFTNESSGEVVEFEPKTTDNTGVAQWVWEGSGVGSGTWEVVGTAGDETSAASLLYIQ